MCKGLVSTIIPVFNRPGMLREAVASVLDQTYRPVEIIIVDDGSTDDTPEVAGELANQHDCIFCITITNNGPGAARETGRQLARGEFIQYLDSDDLLLPEKFSLQIQGLRDHPECGVSYGKTRYYHVNDIPTDIPLKRTGEKIEKMFPAFLQSRWWSTNTPLWRRKVTDRAGAWLCLRHEEDWEYDCRVAAFGTKLHFCNAFVSETRDHNENRLCKEQARVDRKLHDRAVAHELIFNHAIKAGITTDAPEMQHFARECFLLCRQCGAAGLAEEAELLFNLAREASGQRRGNGFDFRLYRCGARILGWRVIGTLACITDCMRR